MADRIHSRLDWAIWRRRLDRIACDSAIADPRDQAEHLLAFLDLIEQAPELSLLEGVIVPGAGVLEKALAIGACESAALAFVAPETGCMISRGGDGFHLASIALPGSAAEASAQAATMALAVLAALAGAIGDLASGSLRSGLGTPPASRLLH
ncbi:MAG: hypothetical protein KGM17_03980 [Sphingomonadales bacterium]|nr:hypothetical protein [Sphingomonadales bacterium]